MHPEKNPKPLEAQLGALPQPPVPTDLEARLLAAIPAVRPSRKPQRRAVLVGFGSALAACLLILLLWQVRGAKNTVQIVPMPGGTDVVRGEATPAPDDDAKVAPRVEARRVLGRAETGVFVWPVAGPMPATILTRIPPDLLN